MGNWWSWNCLVSMSMSAGLSTISTQPQISRAKSWNIQQWLRPSLLPPCTYRWEWSASKNDANLWTTWNNNGECPQCFSSQQHPNQPSLRNNIVLCLVRWTTTEDLVFQFRDSIATYINSRSKNTCAHQFYITWDIEHESFHSTILTPFLPSNSENDCFWSAKMFDVSLLIAWPL